MIKNCKTDYVFFKCLFIEEPVSSQKSSHLHVFMVSILCFYIYILYFGIVLTVWLFKYSMVVLTKLW